MSVLLPNEVIEVRDFNEFCDVFKIESNQNTCDDQVDEELIITELEKMVNQKWIVNFIDNKVNGYFRLQLFE